MDTTWLEDFLAVMENGTFSRAADRRAVSQPAFSHRIRALEQWVGTDLFDRSSHAVCLTPAGHRFLPAAEEMLRRLQIAQADALSAHQMTSEKLRLAATHVLSLTFFPLWLRALEVSKPTTVTVELTADTMVACEKLMAEGRVQMLLCHHHPAAATRLTTDTFRSIELGHDVLLPVAAPSLFKGGVPSLDGPRLAYTVESGMGRILTAAWAAEGRDMPHAPAFSSHLASVLAAMARDGRGIAWAPMSLIADDLASGRLVAVGSERDEVRIDIRLFRPKARQTKAAESLWDRAVRLQAEKNAISSASVSSGRSS